MGPEEEQRDLEKRQREIESYLRDVEQSLLEDTVREAHMEEALKTRALIGQAMGILMVHKRCTADEAFETLKDVSQNTNVKLREVAARLVAAADERANRGISDERLPEEEA